MWGLCVCMFSWWIWRRLFPWTAAALSSMMSSMTTWSARTKERRRPPWVCYLEGSSQPTCSTCCWKQGGLTRFSSAINLGVRLVVTYMLLVCPCLCCVVAQANSRKTASVWGIERRKPKLYRQYSELHNVLCCWLASSWSRSKVY